MIDKKMFYSVNPALWEYSDMKLEDIIIEYLYCKGTWDDNGKPCNKFVSLKELVASALWLYELKDNPTNKRNVLYYCEKRARQLLWMINKHGDIKVPEDIWNKCNEYNKRMCNKGGEK